jgi:hypothetical protein
VRASTRSRIAWRIWTGANGRRGDIRFWNDAISWRGDPNRKPATSRRTLSLGTRLRSRSHSFQLFDTIPVTPCDNFDRTHPHPNTRRNVVCALLRLCIPPFAHFAERQLVGTRSTSLRSEDTAAGQGTNHPQGGGVGRKACPLDTQKGADSLFHPHRGDISRHNVDFGLDSARRFAYN